MPSYLDETSGHEILGVIMGDFWKEFLFNNAIGIILLTVKSDEGKINFKRAFLKIRNAINNAFSGDPDFS